MAEKMKLPQTKGTFEVQGKVIGTKSERFYSEKETKTGKPRRVVSFGVQTDAENTVYVVLEAMEQEKVYFSSREKEKVTTVAVDWAKRNTFSQEGYQLIGVRLGLTKKLDAKGKYVNDNKVCAAFDACEVISEHLKDDMYVYVRGTVEYGHYAVESGETRKSIKYVIQQVSLSADMDFTKTDFKSVSNFEQTLVFQNVSQVEVDGDKYGVLTALIVNYNGVEEAEFVVRDPVKFKLFKTHFVPYMAVKVFGQIVNKVIFEDTESDTGDDDGWGVNPMDKKITDRKKEMLITGADKDSVDKKTYTQEVVDEFIRSKNEFGDNTPISSSATSKDDDGWGTL